SIPINALVIDPANSNVLYAGTDIGVYSSTDGGANWAPFGAGFPRVAVFDLAIQPSNRILRAGTHGRGVWEIPLISPGSSTVQFQGSSSQSITEGQVSMTITINDNDASNGPNQIDVSSFFVRQHYIDFLNREADSAGLSFWTNNIDNCTPKPSCTELQRINTSAAFFISIEFQNTGYLVDTR